MYMEELIPLEGEEYREYHARTGADYSTWYHARTKSVQARINTVKASLTPVQREAAQTRAREVVSEMLNEWAALRSVARGYSE